MSKGSQTRCFLSISVCVCAPYFLLVMTIMMVINGSALPQVSHLVQASSKGIALCREQDKLCTPSLAVTFLSSAKTTSLRKISTVINHHHSPLFGKSWMILVHLSWFKEFWHVLLWMLKFFFFADVSFHHLNTFQKVAQRSDNINWLCAFRGEKRHVVHAPGRWKHWRNLTLTEGASVED